MFTLLYSYSYGCVRACTNSKNQIHKLQDDLRIIDQEKLNKLIESSVRDFNPVNFDSPVEIEKKFYKEYIKTFNNILNYNLDKEKLLDKLIEKKNKFNRQQIKLNFYCVYMDKNNKIKIIQTSDIFNFTKIHKDILYIIEYIELDKTNSYELVSRYKKIDLTDNLDEN